MANISIKILGKNHFYKFTLKADKFKQTVLCSAITGRLLLLIELGRLNEYIIYNIFGNPFVNGIIMREFVTQNELYSTGHLNRYHN